MTMPNFLIIGASRCGTTSLYNYLKQHPDIYMSSKKEPRFFAFEGETINFSGPEDLEKYKYVTDIETYQKLFKNASKERGIGEASTCYLYIKKAPERIHYYLPNAKLIAILRNPVDKAYSSFSLLRREGIEPLNDFSQAIAAESARIAKNWSMVWHYKQKGFYFPQLQRYFNLFDASQIKIYLYEDYIANKQQVVKDIFSFLGVDDTFVPDTKLKHNASGIPRNQSLHKLLQKSNPLKGFLHSLIPPQFRQKIKNNLINLNLKNCPPLSLEMRQKLIEEYREDILKTQDLIGKDLSKWLII